MECEYDRIQHGTGVAPMSDNGDRDDANGCVYFVEAIGLDRIKIGFARSSPRVRLNELQEGSPLKLRPIGFIPGGRMLEADIHRQFADARTHGEWFNATPELMDYIRVHASTGTYGSHTQTRNTVRVQFSLTADDLAKYERLAEEDRAPGMQPNISAVVRKLLHSYRKSGDGGRDDA